MKKLLLLWHSVLMAFVALSSETCIINGIEWTYEVSDGVATIGQGRWYPSAIDSSTVGEIVVPSSFGEYPVVSIAGCAFADCNLITAVTIPNGVKDIGVEAFSGCTSLERVDIPTSVTNICDWAFEDCSAMKSVVIPDGVVRIGERVFYGCSSLENVSIPDSVVSIGSDPFMDCSDNLFDKTSISGVVLVDGWIVGYTDEIQKELEFARARGVVDYAFSGCNTVETVKIPGDISAVPDGLFSGCKSLKSVEIANGVVSIGANAFSQCSSLAIVEIADSVKRIDHDAFCDCKLLDGFSLPGGVEQIGDYAFYNCSSLSNITIPSNVSNLAPTAFSGCSKLVEFKVSDANIYYSARNKILCSKDGIKVITCPNGLTDVEIPNGVTDIGDESFYLCKSLKMIDVPDGVKKIGKNAFSCCYALTSVTLPDGVLDIGDYAFNYCSSLTGITIPNGVTNIGECAWIGCSLLANVEIPDSVIRIGYNAFSGCRSALYDTTTIPGVKLVDGWVVGYNYSMPEELDLSNVRGIADSVFVYSSLEKVQICGDVLNIPHEAFKRCSSLESVCLMNGVKAIGADAFYGCESLTEIVIPSSVSYVDDTAFEGCYSIEKATVPGKRCGIDFSSVTDLVISDGTETIGDREFCGYDNLQRVVIPSSVTSIGECAFAWCYNLVEVTYLGDEDSISFGDDVFLDTPYYEGSLPEASLPFELIIDSDGVLTGFVGLCPSNLIIPDGVTAIGDYAFYGNYGCDNLESVKIPSSVISIGECAFAWCYNLVEVTYLGDEDSISFGDDVFLGTPYYEASLPFELIIDSDGVLKGFSGPCPSKLTIPDGVVRIGTSAFDGDYYDVGNLTSVTIPATVKTIESYAFYGCNNLLEIKFQGNAPVLDGWLFFYDVSSDCTAYVKSTSTGWGVDIPGKWNEINIEYQTTFDPIPELSASATAAEVAAALEGSADAKLAANITDAATYAAYRTWALGLEVVTPQQVKDSAYAWLSYALDTDALIAAAPKEGDIVIDTFEGAATDGAFEFTVKIDGIAVGDNALEANIRKVFDIEGAEKLASDGAGFSSDNVEVNAAAPENGNVKFTVTPKGGGEKPNSFFFRIKMK